MLSSRSKSISSNDAANPYHPGTSHSCTRTTCAAVFSRTLPQPSGRSTSATASSMDVPGSMTRGARKKIPLELIFFVTSVTGAGSRFPATLMSCNGKFRHALGLRRRSSATLMACVGTRRNVRCGRLVGIFGNLGEDSAGEFTNCTFGSAPISFPPELAFPRPSPKTMQRDVVLGQRCQAQKCLFPQHRVLELNNLSISVCKSHSANLLRECSDFRQVRPGDPLRPQESRNEFTRKNRIEIISALM